MKALLILTQIMLMSFTIAAHANEDIQVVPREKNGKQERKVYEYSSEHLRMDKEFMVAAQIVGYGPARTVQSGLILGFFLDHSMLLQLELMKGNNLTSGVFFDRVESESYGVHFKGFAGNTFYYKVGLDYIKVTAYNRDTLFTSSNFEVQGNKVGASVSIGNQWQWSGFTMGCDWVGISVPLTHTTTTNTYGTEYTTGKAEYYIEQTDVQLVHFYLGASF